MNLIILFVLFPMFYIVNAYIDDDKLNVGTVLFKQSDLSKRCWDASMLDLLEARRYLQNILPSPNLVNAVNDQYLVHLLKYFDHSYEIIKRDVNDPATKHVMKYALSDAIGGYLKTWVLPVSKYSYYGGTISLDNVLKVTKVYDNIKRELNTDGEGWRKDEELISYFPIDIAPLNMRDSRFYEGSCDDLAYYEKSDSGYSIPVPVINWDICPSTMFMPLKTPSLVSLDSTNCTTSLVNYYELIQNCVNNIDNWKDFDDRFQTWLMTDVAPHLGDDCLYVPFGGVLGVMNRNKLHGNFFKSLRHGYDKVMDSCFPGSMLFSGKKFIITVIVFLELVWCLPTLYYVICCKKKKRKRRWSLLFCFKRKIKKNAFYVGTSTDDSDIDSDRDYSSSSDRTYRTINDFQPSAFGTRYSNIETDSQNKLTSFSHQHIPCLDSRQSESKPLLKSQSSKTKSNPRDTVQTECEDKKKSIKKSKSHQSHKSKHSAYSSEKVLQDFSYSQYFMNAKTQEEASVNVTLDSHDTVVEEHKISQQKPLKTKEKVSDHTLTVQEEQCTTLHCPCANNVRDEAIFAYNNKSSVIPKKREKKVYKVRKYSTEVRREGRTVRNENDSAPIRKDTAPTLRINIARPETEIKVGISTYKEYTRRNVRPSKIPRFNAAGAKETVNESTPVSQNPPRWVKVKKAEPKDDIEQGNDTEKLNVTL